MGTGYTRNDVGNNIADGNVINASDLDGEFDAVEGAFNASTGHTHDGTTAEGGSITKLGPNQDVDVGATAVTPNTDNTVDLGSSLLEFKDLYIDGTANIDSLVADTADINAGTIDNATLTSVTLVTSDLGTPTAGTLTNATGLPVSTGIAGLGTSVATALAVNVGSSGAFVLFDGALGTPSTGTLSTCTVDGTNPVGFKNIPQSGSAKTTSYILATGDVGKFIEVGASGSIEIPDATFAAGDVLSIFNNTAGDVTITCTITTAYIAGADVDEATVTLATRGICTILFISGTVCVISGNVS